MDKSLARLRAELIGAEINLGEALVSMSQLAYRAGNSTVGEFAQKRAEAA